MALGWDTGGGVGWRREVTGMGAGGDELQVEAALRTPGVVKEQEMFSNLNAVRNVWNAQ